MHFRQLATPRIRKQTFKELKLVSYLRCMFNAGYVYVHFFKLAHLYK